MEVEVEFGDVDSDMDFHGGMFILLLAIRTQWVHATVQVGNMRQRGSS
jgi:hypothetical protein